MTDATNSTTMEDMMRRMLGGIMAVTLIAAALVTVRAQAAPEVKLPPSPQGQASVQVGGRWEKTNGGGQRYAISPHETMIFSTSTSYFFSKRSTRPPASRPWSYSAPYFLFLSPLWTQ